MPPPGRPARRGAERKLCRNHLACWCQISNQAVLFGGFGDHRNRGHIGNDQILDRFFCIVEPITSHSPFLTLSKEVIFKDVQVVDETFDFTAIDGHAYVGGSFVTRTRA